MNMENFFEVVNNKFIIPVIFRGETVNKYELHTKVLDCDIRVAYFACVRLEYILGQLQKENLRDENIQTIFKLKTIKNTILTKWKKQLEK